jgi:hypothetical protein
VIFILKNTNNSFLNINKGVYVDSLSSVIRSTGYCVASEFAHNSDLRENEPDWSELDKSSLPWEAFANWSSMDKEKKSTWKYPHHFIVGGSKKGGIYDSGTMYLHKGGLNAAWAAAQGARSGEKAKPEIIKHLEAHRKAIKE